MPDYNGLTRNQWPGTWSPSSSHPIVLDTEMRGGLRYVSGSVGDRLSNITGQRLQDGMIVYVENGYTENLTTYEGGKYYKYTVLPSESRNASTGELPNDSANWGLFSTSDISEGTNQYYTTAKADSDARSALVGFQAGGDGSFSYDSATGIFTYTGPSAEEVRAHFTANKGLSLTSGEFNIDSANVKGMFSGGTGITYNSTSGEIKTNDGQIVHNSLSGYDANEHIDHTTVSVTAGAGLTGGGDISSTKTINVVGGKGIIANTNDIQVDSANLVTLARNSLSGSNSLDYNSSTGDFRLPQPLDSAANPTFNQLRGPSTFVIDPAAIGDNTGTLRVLGNLTVEGTTTTINSTNVSVNDKTFTIADSAADSSGLNDAGIIWGGSSITANRPTFKYNHANERFNSNRPISANLIGNVTGQVSDISNHTTDDLAEGTTNEYYLKSRVDSDIASSLNDEGNVVNITLNQTIGSTVDSAYVVARVGNAPFLDSDNLTSGTFTGNIRAAGFTSTGDVTIDSVGGFLFDVSEKELKFGDNYKATFGTGGDLEIFHNGSFSRIRDTGPGNIAIDASGLSIRNAAGTETILSAHQNTGVKLYDNNIERFETTDYGVAVTGQLVADSATFTNVTGTIQTAEQTNITKVGNLQELRVDGEIDARGGITDNAGPLVLQAKSGEPVRLRNHSGSNIISATNAGAAKLNYTSSLKLETTAYGVTVNGTVNADSATFTNLTVNGTLSGTAQNVIASENNSTDESVFITFVDGATGSQGIETDTHLTYNPGTNTLSLGSGGDALTIDDAGEIKANGNTLTLNSTSATAIQHQNNTKLNTTAYGVTVTGTMNADSATITGNITAASLDISGNVDVDGTLEADAITVDGDTLATVIAGTTVTNATNAANVAVADESTDTTCFPLFVTSNTGNVPAKVGSNLTFNSNSGILHAPILSGTLQTAEQTNITSLGTLTGLTSTGDVAVDSVGGFLFDVSAKKLKFGDNYRATFGAGGDLQIYHDGSHSYIQELGTGNLNINSSFTNIFGAGGTSATFYPGNSVDLYYNNVKKFQTTDSGVSSLGNITVNSNALEIGNHAFGGGTYHGLRTGFMTGGNDFMIISGEVDGNTYLSAKSGESVRIRAGGNDATHQLQVTSFGVIADGDFAFDSANAVFFDNSSQKLSFGDAHRLTFGTDSDLEIYHDGSNSYIVDGGTGNLILQTGQFQLKNASGNESLIVATGQAAVNLYYDNVNRLQTTPYGATVNGTINADSATVTNLNVDSATIANFRINTDSAVFGDTIKINGNGNKGLLIGDEALGVSNDYVGMKSTNMTEGSEYMILTGLDGSSGQNNATFLSAADGCSVFIRGGKNTATHQIEVSQSIAKAHGNFEITGTLNGHTIPSGAGTLALTSDISGGGGLDSAGVRTVRGPFLGSDTSFNTGFGRNAFGNQSTGVRNTAFGDAAAQALTQGDDNTFIGQAAGASVSTASDNTHIGSAAGSSQTGSRNTSVGAEAGQYQGNVSDNTQIGYRAGGNTGLSGGSAQKMVAVGVEALNSLGLGANGNVAVGYHAGQNATSGGLNTFVGYQSGKNMTTGGANVIIGSYDGNSGGLDIRTKFKNIVLSDGAGNVRAHFDSSIANFKGDVIVDSNLSVAGSISADSATIDGDLTIGTRLIFEGSTHGDGNFAELFINPTGHRVFALPNVSGTILTNNNSGGMAATTNASDVDHFVIADGDVLKRITPADLGFIDSADLTNGSMTNLVADSATFTNLTLSAGATINEFSTDTTLGGNSDNAVPTEKAVKTYVDTEVAGAGGVTNPMSANLDGGGKQITNVASLSIGSSTYELNSSETTTSSTSQAALVTLTKTSFGAAKFIITAVRSGERQISEILATHDGSTAVGTEFGTVTTNGLLATYDVDINGSNFRLLVTPNATTSTTFKVVQTLIEA